jgi:hypothetical protein
MPALDATVDTTELATNHPSDCSTDDTAYISSFYSAIGTAD